LPTPRSRASGAVIAGKIAVIGGIDADSRNSDRVELYDPVNRTWARSDALTTPRHGQSSAFAKDALIVLGGYVGNPMEQTTSVEVWRPNQGWKSAAEMPSLRGFAATVVFDGRVFVFGSRGGAEHPAIYDPSTNIWAESKAKDVPRHRAAVVEHAGRAYFFFGEETGGKALAVFDLARDSWLERF
jgi:N-acetylneuraminic acid mutarotase